MLRRILLLAALTAPMAVQAQSAPTPAPAPAPASPANPAPSVRPLSGGDAEFLQQQSELVRQLRLLTLQTQVAEQQKKLRDANAPSDAGGGGGGAPAAGGDAVNLPPIPLMRPGSTPQAGAAAAPMPNLPPVAPAEPTSNLSVASVWGVDGRYVADMLAPGGLRVSVRQGDALPDGWRVVKVLRTGVIIEKGRKRQTLMVGG